MLVIQETSAWGLYIADVLLNEFGISATIISSAMISSTDLTQYDLIITASDESSTYYTNISANQNKFEEFVNSGGIIQYQLATQGSNLKIVGGTDVINGNQENFNTVKVPNHPILKDLPSQLEGSSANHCYFTNLLPNAVILTETANSKVPTTIEYKFGLGSVIATGMTWEFLYVNSYNSELLLPNALSYSLSLINNLSWISLDINSDTIPKGTSINFGFNLNANKLEGGDYLANLIINSNDPVNT